MGLIEICCWLLKSKPSMPEGAGGVGPGPSDQLATWLRTGGGRQYDIPGKRENKCKRLGQQNSRRRERRTLLSTVDILELLKTTADLLRSAALPSVLVDIIRDEPVSFWEPAERARVSRVRRLVLQEGWLEND